MGVRYRLSRALESFLLRRSDHVTTICEGLRQEIIGRGVDEDCVTVIPNAVDVDRFNAPVDKHNLRAQTPGPDRTFRVGFIGSFYRYEGLEILLEAAASLRNRNVPIDVVLVGGGPEEEALKRLAVELDISDSVTFTGRVDNAKVGSYYHNLDALIYPRHSSRLTEMVTPLKPLEAMANEKLVLATDIGGHRELIEDGVTGLFFPPDDAAALADLIENVAADPSAWVSVAESGRAFVREHRNWRASVARYEKVYAV
jgi:glycosyltransferase involved in cell wall biosynthesis